MDHKEQSSHDVETLLSQMPTIKDTRSKEEVWQRLVQDPSFELKHSSLTSQKSKRTKWIPITVTAAAVVTFSILAATLVQNNPEMKDVAVESSNDDVNMMAKDTATSNKESDQTIMMSREEPVEPLSVFTSDLEQFVPFHIGLVKDANVIPVTYLIPKDEIQQQFGTESPTEYELYMNYASQIQEEQLGYNEYHPYVGTLKADGETLVHQLPYGNPYDLGSASVQAYDQSLQETFRSYKEVRFEDEAGNPMEFSMYGPREPLHLTQGLTYTSYYLYKISEDEMDLVPNLSMTYTTINEAMDAMKVVPNDFYESVIPEDISFQTIDEKGKTRIVFDQPVNLSQLDPLLAERMIEGIILTASTFGGQVQFENIEPLQWNAFDFSQVIEPPVGPNKKMFP